VKPDMDLPETFELFIAAHDLQARRCGCADVTVILQVSPSAPKRAVQHLPRRRLNCPRLRFASNKLQCQPILLQCRHLSSSNSIAPLIDLTVHHINLFTVPSQQSTGGIREPLSRIQSCAAVPHSCDTIGGVDQVRGEATAEKIAALHSMQGTT
jgi:hypothetical protein